MKKLAPLLVLLSLSSYANEKEASLSEKLESLNIPSDKVTPILSQDKIYAVNARYSSLNKRHELTLGGGHNFTADSHLTNRNMTATYRFHWNSKWSFGARYTEYFNELSGAGEKLFESEQLLPDSDFALKSTEAFVNYNTVYGKLRLTQDTIVYFDQYIALGYGDVALSRGEAKMATADLGFAFWIGKHMSSRIGVRNEFYEQKKLNGPEEVHNAVGYLEIGYLFGEGARI